MVITESAWLSLTEQAAAGAPYEVCSVLAGYRPCRHQAARAIVNLAMINISDTPRHRFAVAPDDQLSVWETIDRTGLHPLAICHSHPDAAPTPSDEDIEFHDPSLVMVISGLDVESTDRAMTCRGWLIKGGIAYPEPLIIDHRISRSSEIFDDHDMA